LFRPRPQKSFPACDTSLCWLWITLAAGFVLSAVTGCGLRRVEVDQAPEIDVRVLTSPTPPRVGSAELTLELLDPAGLGVDLAVLQVRGDMLHPGMAPVDGIVGQAVNGHYPVAFEWSMAGDWILTVDGQLQDGRRLLRTFELRVEPVP